MKPLLLLVLLASVAYAETQVSVRWGDYTETRAKRVLVRLHGVEDGAVDHATLTVADRPSGVHAVLRFELSTKLRDAHTLELPIEVTAGTRVIGMAYSIGGERPIEAFTHDAEEARRYFEAIVDRRRDPALLRMIETTERRDRLQLAVFPVTRGMPASVTIEMLLPDAEQVVFDPGPHQRSRTLKLPERDATWLTGLALDHPRERDSDTFEHVTMTTALVAGDEPVHTTRPVPRSRHLQALPEAVAFSDRRYELRTLIRAHAQQLAHCYEYGVIQDPQLSPTAQLALDVAADGRVTRVDVSGELADGEVRWCIADEIRGWKLSAADHAREVRQALDLLKLD
jgi:hypothetical protein